MKHAYLLASLFASVAALSGCGGGSDAPAPVPAAPTDAVPPSASASAAGLKSYLAALGTMPVEDKEPLDLGSFAPAGAEDAEPEPV